MFGINRFKRMLSGGNTFAADGTFESYYGSILRERQEGGPNAQEARRDFENLRASVGRISVY
jgi:hypothetical protein